MIRKWGGGLNVTRNWVCLLVGVEPIDNQTKDQEKEGFIITCGK